MEMVQTWCQVRTSELRRNLPVLSMFKGQIIQIILIIQITPMIKCSNFSTSKFLWLSRVNNEKTRRISV